MSKESMFDEKIRPLVESVVTECKAAGINLGMVFALDQKLDSDGKSVGQMWQSVFSTPDQNDPGLDRLYAVYEAYRGTPHRAAIIVLGGSDDTPKEEPSHESN